MKEREGQIFYDTREDDENIILSGVNVCKNLSLETESLEKCEKPKKACILTAGTSLDKLWDEIRQDRQDGFKILCASRALICCKKYGVKADFVCHVDPTDLTDHFFDEVKTEDSILITTPTANPELLRKFKGKIYFFIGPGTDTESWEQLRPYSKLPMGRHISATMLSVALNWNTEIKLYGFDYWIRAARVDDPIHGTAIVKFQQYADPINRPAIDYKKAAVTYRGSHGKIITTWPYKIGKGRFTTDDFQSNKSGIRDIFNYYGRTPDWIRYNLQNHNHAYKSFHIETSNSAQSVESTRENDGSNNGSGKRLEAAV